MGNIAGYPTVALPELQNKTNLNVESDVQKLGCSWSIESNTTTVLPQFQNETNIDAQIDINDINKVTIYSDALLDQQMGSWFAAMIGIVGIFMCPLGGWLGGVLGRRKLILLTAPIMVIGWAILGTAETTTVLFCGRILTVIPIMLQVGQPGKNEYSLIE